jgi:hypothetical protein
MYDRERYSFSIMDCSGYASYLFYFWTFFGSELSWGPEMLALFGAGTFV